MRKSLLTTPTLVGGPSVFSKVFSSSRLALLVVLGSVLLNCNPATAQESKMAHEPVGSWVATFDVPSFGAPITLLFSFFKEGILIETDTPSPGPLFGPSTVDLANGHGVWKPTGKGTATFVYRKEIYPGNSGAADPFGNTKTTGTVTVGEDGQTLQFSNLKFVFTDTSGNVLFTATGSGAATRIAVDEAAN
jgi:hypothetical protein